MIQNIFNNNQPKPKKELKSDVKKKELEMILSSQRRHPILDRVLIIGCIISVFIVSIPFIYIGAKLSFFGNIEKNSLVDQICNLFEEIAHNQESAAKLHKDVPVFQLRWDQAQWIFEAIGTCMLIGIIVILALLTIIYARDIVAIFKSIGILISKNVENTIEVVKEQTEDSKKIALAAPTVAEDPDKKEKKNLKKKKSKDPEVVENKEMSDLDKQVEKIKEEIKLDQKEKTEKKEEAEEDLVAEKIKETKLSSADDNPLTDLSSLSDEDLDKILATNKKEG